MIQSVDHQLGHLDEVVVISDGPNDETRKLVSSSGSKYVYLETATRMWDYGATPRNIGISRAHGEYIGFMDDDDKFLPGALDAIRRGAIERPGIPLVFRMRYKGDIIWKAPEIKIGNVGSHMLAVPNIPGKLGRWAARYAGDYDFIVHAIALHMGAVAFRKEIIAELLRDSMGQ
jgi:glycosyltransferase involved in cell wall biosynthesis